VLRSDEQTRALSAGSVVQSRYRSPSDSGSDEIELGLKAKQGVGAGGVTGTSSVRYEVHEQW